MKPVTFRKTTRAVLCAFADSRCRCLADLASAIGKSKPTVCRALKRLSSAQMVQRLQLNNSRASLVFTITDEGWRLRSTWLNQPCRPRSSREVITPRDAIATFHPN